MWRWTALGAVYVTDASNRRVVKLASGSATPTVMPFADLNTAAAVAVDSAGNVYVIDTDNHRLLKLAVG